MYPVINKFKLFNKVFYHLYITGRKKYVLQLRLNAAANTQPSRNKKGSTADGWNLLYRSFNVSFTSISKFLMFVYLFNDF